MSACFREPVPLLCQPALTRVQSIDALIEAVNEFEGGVVLVSHDARLILNTDCELFECAGPP